MALTEDDKKYIHDSINSAMHEMRKVIIEEISNMLADIMQRIDERFNRLERIIEKHDVRLGTTEDRLVEHGVRLKKLESQL